MKRIRRWRIEDGRWKKHEHVTLSAAKGLGLPRCFASLILRCPQHDGARRLSILHLPSSILVFA
jgi:hypothetical protein